MSFEAQLKSRYSQAHKRLLNPISIQPKVQVVPISARAPEVKPTLTNIVIHNLSTEKVRPPLPKYTMGTLLGWISKLEGLTPNELKGAIRNKYIARARQIFYYLAYKRSDGRFSSAAIGRYLKKDHTSVLTGAEKIAHLRQTDRALDLRLQQYEHALSIVVEEGCLCSRCPFR